MCVSSSRSCASSDAVALDSSSRFESANAIGGPEASCAEYDATLAAYVSSSNSTVARPMRSASAALMSRPVRMMSLARACPTRRGRNHVTPASGDRPRRTYPAVHVALALTSRRSQARASPNPAPAAAPFTAAITGFSHDVIACTHFPTQ